MEFPEILGFLKILGKSIKLILKNGISIASITILSLLLSSIPIFLFTYLYRFVVTYIDPTEFIYLIIGIVLVFAVEIGAIYAYRAIAQALVVATTVAIATSYTGTKLSLRDLLSTVKTKWRSPFTRPANFPGGSCRYPLHFVLFVAAALSVLVVGSNPNPFTISIMSVVLVSYFVSQIYTSVPWTMSSVIRVVEDGCEALDRAETLVQGQRLHGVMLNFFLYLLTLIIFFAFWKIVGDKGTLNLMVYGLFLANLLPLAIIFSTVAYTVYYFQCVEYHGETIPQPGNFLHAALLPPNHVP